ncbi:hypothetical protein [Burkholderia sp. 9120]|uniref:hypothetical protein n=1 Tax=Burkholderia sp. 9120 TaxID=1500897 RepID=UPI000556FC9E|nr:hypothetical protein [Burkholderia sp. 9120]
MPKEPVVVADVRAQVDTSTPVTPVTFLDRVFRSRTFVFADGSTAPVVSSQITVTLAQQIAEIERHADFERLGDRAGDTF